MPTYFDDFTSSSTINDLDYLVGYTSPTVGGERRWPFSVFKSAVGSSPMVAKAWVNFNGTGTVAIRSSYNVSSITDNGTGDYSINFLVPLSNADYSAVGTTIHSNVTRTVGFKAGTTLATSNFTIITSNDPNYLQPIDTEIVCLQIFGN